MRAIWYWSTPTAVWWSDWGKDPHSGLHATHLSGRSAGGEIRFAQPGVSRRWEWAPTLGDLSDAENTRSKRLGTSPTAMSE